MVISNDAALKLFKTNMDRFYVQYTDLMSHVQYGDTEQVFEVMGIVNDQNADTDV